jgi:7-cyano-7-deazaguanine synthase
MTQSTTVAELFPKSGEALAVLVSGGLDSAILLGEALERGNVVYPLYVRQGLYWEATELSHLKHFLQELAGPNLRSLHILDMPVSDIYKDHWSLTGQGAPDADSADEAVFLPGRNILLLSKALLWCHLNHLAWVALAPLDGNPFPDATPEFFSAYEAIVNRALGSTVHVLRPYGRMSKRDVMLRSRKLPLQWTFSCIHPVNGHHCGQCNKCAERRRAFREAGIVDVTRYESEKTCTA